MRQDYIGIGFRGFYKFAKYATNVSMIDETANKRYKILKFWEKHGLEATIDAFKVSHRTLYNWKKKLKTSTNINVLAKQTTAPVNRRKRFWSAKIYEKIKELRTRHPNLAKEKIYPFLLASCKENSLRCPSIRTIGRLISDSPNKMRSIPQHLKPNGKPKLIKKVHKLRKPKDFTAKYAGHLVALDSIEKFKDGIRRYIITFVDLYSRFSFAIATSSHTSLAAKKFLTVINMVFPYKIENVLTDNGSEFMKDFNVELQKQQINHWHTYPKTPKMNAHCERFNRTIQEEFIDFHKDDLFVDLKLFNNKLLDYLLWFNGERPHFALNVNPPKRQPSLLSPIQFLTYNNFFYFNNQCNLGWPDTLNLQKVLYVLSFHIIKVIKTLILKVTLQYASKRLGCI